MDRRGRKGEHRKIKDVKASRKVLWADGKLWHKEGHKEKGLDTKTCSSLKQASG